MRTSLPVLLAVALSSSAWLGAAESDDHHPPAPAPTPAQLQARHDAATREAKAKVDSQQRVIDNLQKAISGCEKRLAEDDKRVSNAQKQLTNVQDIQQRLTDAKAAMDQADQLVQSEFQKNHNTQTNQGGASDSALQAQDKAQHAYQQLKRDAADAPEQVSHLEQVVKARERERADTLRRKERYEHELDKAQDELLADQKALQHAIDAGAAPPAEEFADHPEAPAHPASDAPVSAPASAPSIPPAGR